jgi:hypothetical protein
LRCATTIYHYNCKMPTPLLTHHCELDVAILVDSSLSKDQSFNHNAPMPPMRRKNELRAILSPPHLNPLLLLQCQRACHQHGYHTCQVWLWCCCFYYNYHSTSMASLPPSLPMRRAASSSEQRHRNTPLRHSSSVTRTRWFG